MKIIEYFTSIQGEGPWVGIVCDFIRTAGCNLNCCFCDTKYAHTCGMEVTPEALTAWIKRPYVVLTGGEPTIQEDFVEVLKQIQSTAYIGVETNGTNMEAIPWDKLRHDDLIVVSPKNLEDLDHIILTYGAHPNVVIKLVISKSQPGCFNMAVLENFEGAKLSNPIYLMPEGTDMLTIQFNSTYMIEYIKTHNIVLPIIVSPRIHIMLSHK